ncbi:hypothetical protein EPR50_G00239480 [Perca flavescens]|uniref:Uncharacterized protein n=1 Tax=Perca flavescens TaxID=8167 RepID=A0A484BYX4_PERFV|nr:hypothetical protein EPR50_G00239480 [Perca flavescens]
MYKVSLDKIFSTAPFYFGSKQEYEGPQPANSNRWNQRASQLKSLQSRQIYGRQNLIAHPKMMMKIYVILLCVGKF